MSNAGLIVAFPPSSGWYAQCEMNPVSAITVIVGTSSVPRNDVSQGPRSGLRQKSGRNGPGGRALGMTCARAFTWRGRGLSR